MNIPPNQPIQHPAFNAPGSPQPVHAADIVNVPTAEQVSQEHSYVDNVKRQRRVYGAAQISEATVGRAIMRASAITTAALQNGQVPGAPHPQQARPGDIPPGHVPPIPQLQAIPGIPQEIINFGNHIALAVNGLQNDVRGLQNDVCGLQNNVRGLHNDVRTIQSHQIREYNELRMSRNRGSRQNDQLNILIKPGNGVAAVGNEPLRPPGFNRPVWDPVPAQGDSPLNFPLTYPQTLDDLDNLSRPQIASLALFYDNNLGIRHNSSISEYRRAFAVFIGARQ